LALCKIASEKGIEAITTEDPLFQIMRTEGEFARSCKKISAKLSLREIALKAGRSTGKGLNDTLKYIRDLSKINIFISWSENGEINEYSSALIGYHRKGGDIGISFHATLSASILGKWDYNSITWSEFESLDDDNARFLIVTLSSRIRPGQKQRLNTETILQDLYGNQEDVSDRSRRQRRADLEQSIESISGTGWEIEKSGKSSYIFTRPKVL
jgi:hypothetical protein